MSNAKSSHAAYRREPPTTEVDCDIAGASNSRASVDRPKSDTHAVRSSEMRIFGCQCVSMCQDCLMTKSKAK